jgi:predicted transcriptional regulator
MVSITLNQELFKKLENLREGKEPIEKVIERLIESYEEMQDYIEERYEKLRREKDKFVDLEDYAASRGL